MELVPDAVRARRVAALVEGALRRRAGGGRGRRGGIARRQTAEDRCRRVGTGARTVQLLRRHRVARHHDDRTAGGGFEEWEGLVFLVGLSRPEFSSGKTASSARFGETLLPI